MAKRTCQYQPRNGKLPCARQPQSDDTNFCAIHMPLTGERIKCTHCGQMIKKGSTTHAEKCSSLSLKTIKLPYYSPDCNLPSFSSQSDCNSSVSGQCTDEHELAARIEALYIFHAADFLEFSSINELNHVSLSTKCTRSDKHRWQEQAIVRRMEQHELLDGQPAVYVEFGSGKGSLSLAIGSSPLANVAASRFICIEKSAYKHKAENSEEMHSYRARIDLRDVNLEKLLVHAEFGVLAPPSGSEESGGGGGLNCCSGCLGVVGIGKHVCGGATDLSLTALKNYHLKSLSSPSASDCPSHMDSDSIPASGGPGALLPVKGVCLALCCHVLCSWDSCVARPWLQAVGNFSESDFDLLRKWSGFFVVDKYQSELEERSEALLPSDKSTRREGCDDSHHFVSFSSRAKLGIMCKRLIDFGRMHYVRSELGMCASLVKFADESITPENMLLLAYHHHRKEE